MSLAFPRATLDDLQRRYFEDGDWAWAATELPATRWLGPTRLARLRELNVRLVAEPPRRRLLDRVLLELLEELIQPPASSALPLWLGDALTRLAEDPDALAAGTPGLAALAGRSPEHVNRVIRNRTGRTATATINELRLTRAATELRMTDQPILQIASGCGIDSLSHFSTLFNARFGLTPPHYRLSHQTLT